jgi:hypothetical protein
LFHGLFGFVGWEEVEFYIPPQPRDDDVKWALGCDYYGGKYNPFNGIILGVECDTRFHD